VSCIDASGLGAIVSLGASAKAAHCRLKLINLNRRLKESLGMARLNEVLAGAAFWRMGLNDYLNSRQSTPDSGSSE